MIFQIEKIEERKALIILLKFLKIKNQKKKKLNL
jgi:hypothetical protein